MTDTGGPPPGTDRRHPDPLQGALAGLRPRFVLGDTHAWTAAPAARSDPLVGPVLTIMHARFGEPWSVATLAREAGLCRSSFAARFAAAVGVPPMHYLLECRMRAACSLLRSGQGCLKGIARRVGYSSEPAFSLAFKRWSGRPPGEYRDAAMIPEP
jgi:transcriptional regulator GlxA family with amidase domain